MIQHQHPEAFCLMQYESDDHSEVEVIWNSRDGVTPFVISLASGKEATHVRWNEDQYAPDHVPEPGTRVFVDLTEEAAHAAAVRNVDHWWDNPKYQARNRWPSKEVAIIELQAAYLQEPGAPSLISAEEYLARG